MIVQPLFLCSLMKKNKRYDFLKMVLLNQGDVYCMLKKTPKLYTLLHI